MFRLLLSRLLVLSLLLILLLPLFVLLLLSVLLLCILQTFLLFLLFLLLFLLFLLEQFKRFFDDLAIVQRVIQRRTGRLLHFIGCLLFCITGCGLLRLAVWVFSFWGISFWHISFWGIIVWNVGIGRLGGVVGHFGGCFLSVGFVLGRIRFVLGRICIASGRIFGGVVWLRWFIGGFLTRLSVRFRVFRLVGWIGLLLAVGILIGRWFVLRGTDTNRFRFRCAPIRAAVISSRKPSVIVCDCFEQYVVTLAEPQLFGT